MGQVVLNGATSGSTTLIPTDAVTVNITMPSTSGTLVTTAGSVSTATNIAGGSAGVVPYQTGSGATSFTSVGTTGQVLTSNGSSAPTWANVSASPAGSSGAIQYNNGGSFGAAGNISNSTTIGFKNRIINGAMVIDQRDSGASVTLTTDMTYTLDRWVSRLTQSSKFSVQQNAGSVTPPVGYTNYLGCTSLSAYSLGTNDYFLQAQRIEGYNVSDLAWGTSNAKTVTLSAWVYSSLTGTFGGSITNYNYNRWYPFSFTISSANTWTQISVTIPGDTTGSWAVNNAIGLIVNFSLGTGSGYSNAAGVWNSNISISSTGAVSVVGTNGATFYFTGVQLEVGTQATSFDYRDYGRELFLCQRYFQILCSATGSATYISPISTDSSTTGFGVVNLPVPMRTSPSLVITLSGGTTKYRANTGNVNDNSNTDPTIANANNFSFRLNYTGFSALTANVSGWVNDRDSTSGYFGVNAEL
jgi:hypothetical protein